MGSRWVSLLLFSQWNDLLGGISTEIKLGAMHRLRVTYLGQSEILSHSYEEITSDHEPLHTIDMYWDIRRLSVQVHVMRNDKSDFMDDVGRQQCMPCVLQGDSNVKQF
jgi:hypothetical protein